MVIIITIKFLCVCVVVRSIGFFQTNKDLLILVTDIGRPLKMENMRYNIVCPQKYTMPFFATLQTLIIRIKHNEGKIGL